MSLLDRALRAGESKQFRQYEKRVARINAFEPELELESDDELRARFDALRERAASGESLDELLSESFAITREVGKRKMGMRHFDVQLIGGMVLHNGAIAEMKTGAGEGARGREKGGGGQVADRHAGGGPQRALGQGRPRRHGQRLPRAPRC